MHIIIFTFNSVKDKIVIYEIMSNSGRKQQRFF